jgi:hypothetical protein
VDRVILTSASKDTSAKGIKNNWPDLEPPSNPAHAHQRDPNAAVRDMIAASDLLSEGAAPLKIRSLLLTLPVKRP